MNFSFRNVKVADFFKPQVTCLLYERDPIMTKNLLLCAVICYRQRKTDGNTSRHAITKFSFSFPYETEKRGIDV